MIRVALHVVAGPTGGPRTYGVALAHALARREDVDLVVLTDQPDLFPEAPTMALRGPRPYADHVVAPRLLRELAPDVYHNTKNCLPFGVPCATVVTLHDLAYHHFPDTFGFASRLYLRWHHERAARRADRIVAVSGHGKDDLVATLRVQRERVRAIHHGVADRFRAASLAPAPPFDAPYLLSVGTIQARKNLDVLVRAYKLLRAYRPEPLRLVIAGRRGWKTEEFDDACEGTDVHVLGEVPDDELPGLYAGATAFVQPSSYEGFGLTAAEAMACGTPVVAADAGSLPEVVGDAGLFVAPRNDAALADAIARLLDEPGLRDRLGTRGRARAQRYTWDRSAEEHAELYREAAHAHAEEPAPC